MLPQNMPGAGTLKLANHLSTAVPRDGTVLGLISRGIPLEPLFGGQNTKFDPLTMTWIGSPDQDTAVCAARKDANVNTIEALKGTGLAVGASGSGADTAAYPEFLNAIAGTKFRVVKGYAGANEIFLAMERNEVQGICVSFQSLKQTRLFASDELTLLFQAGLEKNPNIPAAVPLVTEITSESKADTDALRLFLSRTALGRPLVAPPGVQADRLMVLQQAFDATMKDPAFLAEARKLKLSVEPTSGKDLARIIAEAYSSSRELVQRVSGILGNASGTQRHR